MVVNSFTDVIARLEQIIAWAKTNESPLGYFAALYYKMTIAVRDAVIRGEFENGSRMEQVDVAFAKRYFDAFDTWQAGGTPTESWRISFEVAQDQQITVMQHLLLGMNAHINLDLCIAAASVRQRDAIFGLRHDFMHVNKIIESLTDQTQSQLAKIWLPFDWLDRLFRTEDEGWVGFSISAARGASWKAAQLIAFAPDRAAEQIVIAELDKNVAFFAKKIHSPGLWLRWLLRFMRRWEAGSVKEKIEVLENISVSELNT
ncbi:MAG: hypothetical protein IPH31_04950 [Lewinellaceae bacterium]|jgi:hypothetical protein|nr:hypothetical protein [Lewinellaceae bacterium]